MPVAADYIIPMVRQAYAGVRLRISHVGDGVIAGGVFLWLGFGGHRLRMENSNNHQQTLGVIAAALTAIGDFLSTETGYGIGTFLVYDGDNEVAIGTIH